MPIDFDKLKERIAEQKLQDMDRSRRQAQYYRSKMQKKLEQDAALASELREWLKKIEDCSEVSEQR